MREVRVTGSEDDDGELSVSEIPTYTSASRGPVQDTDVHAAHIANLHGERPAHIDGVSRNRATPDPMRNLRRSAQQSAAQQRSVEAAPTESKWRSRLPLILVGATVVLFLGCAGVSGILAITLLSGPSEPEPVVIPSSGPMVPPPTQRAEPEPAEPSPGSAPAPAPREEFDGVPVRKGLRGE